MVQVLPQQTQHNCLHVTTDSIPVSSITKINKLNKTRKVSVIKCVHITLVVEGNKKLRTGEIIKVGWVGGGVGKQDAFPARRY